MKTILHTANQLTFPFSAPTATDHPLMMVGAEERGAVFTRREVVEFILDLAGYTTEQPLHEYRLLEPSFGEGDFLIPVIDRLLTTYTHQATGTEDIVEALGKAICAVEIHEESIVRTRDSLVDVFEHHGISGSHAHRLLDLWLVHGDFLLVDLPQTFTHAVGNPPYVRQERIPESLLAQYRARYATMYDRADLYVPFIERCLTLLAPNGTLGFICADRWMKNKYGAPLRAMIADRYHLTHYVDLVDTPAFLSNVTTYPAVTIIRHEKPGPTRVVHRPRIESAGLKTLARTMRGELLDTAESIMDVANVTNGRDPWVLQPSDRLTIARRLEAEFPLLEETGCNVGIGVATGADRVFIGPFDHLDVESSRKLPLVTTKDIEGGTVQWTGLGVINPFHDDGSLVDLAEYPRLARYLNSHSETIRNRNCARRNPKRWYRTIDRMYPELTSRPKLLIPDIKGEAHIVYDEGRFYPHHNLYFITSTEWNLKALQAVLRSGIAELFVSLYSTRMRGGYLRFQAQYLRRIRLPRWNDVPTSIRTALVEAAESEDRIACNRATFDLYGLTPHERTVIEQ